MTQDEYIKSIKRNVTTSDYTYCGCTVRKTFEDGYKIVGITVYSPSGIKIGDYKTARGAMKAAERHGAR